MLEEKTYLNIFEDKDIAIFVSEEQKMITKYFLVKSVSSSLACPLSTETTFLFDKRM